MHHTPQIPASPPPPLAVPSSTPSPTHLSKSPMALLYTSPVSSSSVVPPVTLSSVVPPVTPSSVVPPIPPSSVAPPTPPSSVAPPIPSSSMVPPTPPSSVAPPVPPSSSAISPAPTEPETSSPYSPTIDDVSISDHPLPTSSDILVCPPILPNLAKIALDRLKKTKRDMSPEDRDFKPSRKKRVVDQKDGDGSDEQHTCSICFEPWSNSGSHRIVSLKCGHLFGHSCIEKWLKNAGGGKCPQCNCKSKKSDIRVIFAKTVSVVDTTERDRALQDLKREKELRLQAKRDEAQALLQQNLARRECDKLKEEIQMLKAQMGSTGSTASSSSSSSSPLPPSVSVKGEAVINRTEGGRYTIYKNLSVSQSGGARVMAFDPERSMLVVSKPSNNVICPGHGLSKFSTVDFRQSEYVGIHSPAGTIRDMSFRPETKDGLILTASTDKTAKLTSLYSNVTVQSFDLPSPAWACAWDRDNPIFFYCGLQNGTISIFDVRNPLRSVGSLARSDGVRCPVTSLASVPKNASSGFNCSGILMGSLGGCMFWEKSNPSITEMKPHLLQSLPEGSCPSVTFEPTTRHCFSSFRPTKRSPRGKHILFQLYNVPTDKPLLCHPVQQFPGGTTHRLLSRSKLFLRPDSEDKPLAIYGDEGTKTVHIWDTCSTLKLQEISLVREPALDMLPFPGNSGVDFLAILTQSKVNLYQWQHE